METITGIIIPLASLLLGGAVLNFVQFLIQRSDSKKKEEDPVNKLSERLDGLEKSIKDLRRESDLGDCRNQMLILMEHHPMDTFQLLQVAKHYFVDLEGDWYMSALFKKHCQTYAIPLPTWFKDDTKEVTHE